jgi:hypothetical protein
LCVLLLVNAAPVCRASGEPDASLAIGEAEQRVDVCYLAVANAQKAGANVTDLLSVLGEAGMLLSKAQLAFVTGDFSSAYILATQSKARLDGFDSLASSSRDVAAKQRYLDFMSNVVGSAFGTFAVIVGGVLTWFFLRRKYSRSGSVINEDA